MYTTQGYGQNISSVFTVNFSWLVLCAKCERGNIAMQSKCHSA